MSDGKNQVPVIRFSAAEISLLQQALNEALNGVPADEMPAQLRRRETTMRRLRDHLATVPKPAAGGETVDVQVTLDGNSVETLRVLLTVLPAILEGELSTRTGFGITEFDDLRVRLANLRFGWT